MLTSTHRSGSRLSLTLTALVVFAPMFSLSAQETKDARVIPGVYQEGPCAPAPFPSVLPAVNDVLDSAAVAQVLGEGGLAEPLILSLRLGSLDSDPRVRVLGKPKSADAARRIAATVQSAIRPVPADTPLAFRLLFQPGGAPSITLSRSELCPPALKPGPERTQSFKMEEGQFVEWQRKLEEEARLRKMVVFRVLVRSDGKAGEVMSVAASGDRRIDNQVQQIVTRASYFPAKLDGASVPAWLQVGGGPH